jgi:hypothetical protein
MTQEQKELLLKDLCSRLPYGVKCKYYDCSIGDFGEGTILGFERRDRFEIDGVCICVDDVRPYLFPLSSMTEGLIHEFYCMFIENDISFEDFVADYWNINSFHKLMTSIDDCGGVVEWFNENHCDYRGLIEKGLAIDATNLNVYYQ